MYKVSVIVPVYNVEAYINKCLDSLVNQTLKEIEIIVVNDGTKDNSQVIIDKYAKEYDNVKSFIKENGGLSDARNYGIKKAHGEYIAFVDSDDYVDLDMYNIMYTKAKKGDFDMVVCDAYSVSKRLDYRYSNIDDNVFTKEGIKKYFTNIYPPVWNKIYKRKFFDKFEFKKGVWFEDVEFLYRLLPSIESVGVVKAPLYYYVQREGAITSKVNNKIYDYVDNMNSVLKFYKDNNLLDEYYDEIEYCYVRYLYATFIKRVMGFSYSEFLKAMDIAIKNVSDNFPNYHENKYFRKSLKGYYLLKFNNNVGKLLYKLKYLFPFR
ncbi:MAG: glycosyltransferase [Bacilli bacterium]|nr:glycosyltransferase [Bacilli bacterium]